MRLQSMEIDYVRDKSLLGSCVNWYSAIEGMWLHCRLQKSKSFFTWVKIREIIYCKRNCVHRTFRLWNTRKSFCKGAHTPLKACFSLSWISTMPENGQETSQLSYPLIWTPVKSEKLFYCAKNSILESIARIKWDWWMAYYSWGKVYSYFNNWI